MSNNLEAQTAKLNLEQIEENSPKDAEFVKKDQNLTEDQEAFTAEDGSKSKKKKNNKQPKNKTKKGEDFLEYAKKHEIDVNIKYEKSPERKDREYRENRENRENREGREEDQEKKPFYKNNYYNNNNSHQGNNYYNKEGGKQNYYNKGGKYNNRQNYQNKKQYYDNNNNYQGQQQMQQKTFNNKFDPMNGSNNHPYMFNPMGNQMMRPDMMYFGQMPMQPNTNPHNNERPEDHHNIGEKGVKESLEYYLSLENLNKDLFIRQKIDSEGYIEAEDILKFNNMKKQKVDINTIREIVNENNSMVEEKVVNDKIFLRSKLWNEIKHNLISLEELEARKTQKKGNYNYNYVTMQNNYFMPMMPYDQMLQGGGMPMNQFMPPMPNMMGMNQYRNQEN